MSESIPFGLKIAIINRAFRKKMDEKASAMGLTSVQLRVLGSVSRLEEAGVVEIHQNDLEKLERVTHPAMTKLIRKLENKGFLSCETSASDKRYKKITATEKTHGMHKVILEHDAEVLNEMCRNFTEEQKEMLIKSISKLFENTETE